MSFAAPANLRRAILLAPLLAAFPLLINSCAKRESAAERNAEIEQRVQQRLEAEHQAKEQERLAQREAALAMREKALAAQEHFFATMLDSRSPDTAVPPGETESSESGDFSPAAESSSALPLATYPTYVEPDNYLSDTEPLLAPEPIFFAPATPIVTIVNQNALVIQLNRNHPRGRQHHHSGYPPRPANGMGTGSHVTRSAPTRTT